MCETRNAVVKSVQNMPHDLTLQNTRPKTLATADPPTMMSMMPTSALSTRGRNRLAMAVPIGMPAATATLMTAERPTSSELRRAATRKAQMPFGRTAMDSQ